MGIDIEPGVTPKPAAVEPLAEQPKPVLPKPILAVVNKDVVANLLCDEFSEVISKTAEVYKIEEKVLKGTIYQGLIAMKDDDLSQLLKNIESGTKEFSGKDLGSRVGLGQVVMVSAGAIESRGSGVSAEEHTSTNFNRIAQEQQDPTHSLKTLAKVINENRSLYTENLGKSAEDLLSFALAKHLLGREGRDIIGRVQTSLDLAADQPVDAGNSWEKVSSVLSQGKYQEVMERLEAVLKSTSESPSLAQLAAKERK